MKLSKTKGCEQTSLADVTGFRDRRGFVFSSSYLIRHEQEPDELLRQLP
jgi:hypothetical protein